MSKITLITGKQGSGKTTLRHQLGGLDKETREITLEEIDEEFKSELLSLLQNDNDDSYFFECQGDSDNIDFSDTVIDHPHFKWYETYGFRGEGMLSYDTFPFLPF